MPCHIKGVTLLQEEFPTDKWYPFNLEILNKVKHLVFDSPVTLFVGENGTGKSTLLEAIARACGIHIWTKSEGRRYRFNRYEKELYMCLSVHWTDGRVPGAFFGSETFKDFANIVDEWAASDPAQLKYFGGESLVTQSHGQSMMSYFRSRYKIKGLYLLDEPETALSPRSQMELIDIIKGNSEAGHAQFIVSTHSPILLSCDGAVVYSFDYSPPRVVEYRDTDHYRIYRRLFI